MVLKLTLVYICVSVCVCVRSFVYCMHQLFIYVLNA